MRLTSYHSACTTKMPSVFENTSAFDSMSLHRHKVKRRPSPFDVWSLPLRPFREGLELWTFRFCLMNSVPMPKEQKGGAAW